MTRTRATALVAAAVVVAAFNLRTAASSIGPLLTEISGAVGLGPTGAGLLTSLPIAAFAVMGAMAAPLARRVGEERALTAALVAMVAGVLLRAVTDDVPAFLVLSAVALVGGAIGNVVLPAIVRQWFPQAIGSVSAAYATSLALGATLGAALSAPVAEVLPDLGWRAGTGVWALPAAAGVVLWLVVLRLPHPSHPADASSRDASAAATGPLDRADAVRLPARAPRRPIWRDRRAVALAVFFAAQSAQAYVHLGWFATFWREAGASAAIAGALVGVVAGTSMLMSVVVAPVAARLRTPLPLVVGLVALYAAGYVGLLLAPVSGGWLWAVLVGAGSGSFPLALALIALLADDPGETSRLSGFVQSAGYALAMGGPVLFGALRGWTGGWLWSFALLGGLLLVQSVAGVVVSRARADQVERTRPGRVATLR